MDYSKTFIEEYEPGRFRKVGVCIRCGNLFSNGNPSGSKYCNTCRELVRKEQSRERQRRFNERRKQDTGK